MIGLDIVDIRRIDKLKTRKGFLAKVFSPAEIEYINDKNQANQTIAGLFAAKEAVAKLFGVGISKRLGFKDIEILHDNNSPYININLEKISKLMNDNNLENLSISISHDGDMAIAVVSSSHKSYPKVDRQMAALLPERDKNFHKYDYGKCLLIGGSKGMAGSITLAGLACMRSGAGLVHILVPEAIEYQVNSTLLEAIVKSYPADEDGNFADFDQEHFQQFIKGFDAIAIGPGLGKKEAAKKMIATLFKHYDGPLVIDADAINLLAAMKANLPEKKNVYITGHEMEFSRLSGLDIKVIRNDRLAACAEFLKEFDCNLLLKGHDSIVANRKYTYVNKTGSSALATAGSGDSLTGIMLAFLARHDHADMMKLAVYVHGLCGDFAASDLGEDSVIASDLATYLPKVLKALRKEVNNGN